MASRSWKLIADEVARYEAKAWRPFAWAMGSIAAMFVIGVTTENVLLALLPLTIGVTIAIVLSSAGVTCPACRTTIQHGTHGNAGAIMLLVNLRQCPHCQFKFDEP